MDENLQPGEGRSPSTISSPAAKNGMKFRHRGNISSPFSTSKKTVTSRDKLRGRTTDKNEKVTISRSLPSFPPQLARQFSQQDSHKDLPSLASQERIKKQASSSTSSSSSGKGGRRWSSVIAIRGKSDNSMSFSQCADALLDEIKDNQKTKLAAKSVDAQSESGNEWVQTDQAMLGVVGLIELGLDLARLEEKNGSFWAHVERASQGNVNPEITTLEDLVSAHRLYDGFSSHDAKYSNVSAKPFPDSPKETIRFMGFVAKLSKWQTRGALQQNPLSPRWIWFADRWARQTYVALDRTLIAITNDPVAVSHHQREFRGKCYPAYRYLINALLKLRFMTHQNNKLSHLAKLLWSTKCKTAVSPDGADVETRLWGATLRSSPNLSFPVEYDERYDGPPDPPMFWAVRHLDAMVFNELISESNAMVSGARSDINTKMHFGGEQYSLWDVLEEVKHSKVVLQERRLAHLDSMQGARCAAEARLLKKQVEKDTNAANVISDILEREHTECRDAGSKKELHAFSRSASRRNSLRRLSVGSLSRRNSLTGGMVINAGPRAPLTTVQDAVVALTAKDPVLKHSGSVAQMSAQKEVPPEMSRRGRISTMPSLPVV
jgi:hypothetical protein